MSRLVALTCNSIGFGGLGLPDHISSKPHPRWYFIQTLLRIASSAPPLHVYKATTVFRGIYTWYHAWIHIHVRAPPATLLPIMVKLTPSVLLAYCFRNYCSFSVLCRWSRRQPLRSRPLNIAKKKSYITQCCLRSFATQLKSFVALGVAVLLPSVISHALLMHWSV